MLQKAGSVSSAMIHVTDWLPTILHAAGFDITKLPKNLDGHDMWKALVDGMEGTRDEILHNIEPLDHRFAIRVKNMKLISGLFYKNYDGWYPPEQAENEANQGQNLHSDLVKILQKYGPVVNDPHPVVVECKRTNSSKHCDPVSKPCLFDISKDPCEYNNIADEYPQMVEQLLERVKAYNATAVPFRGKPEDPKGLPLYHNGAWDPWIKL